MTQTPKEKAEELKLKDITAVDWLCNFIPPSVKKKLANRIEEAREIEQERIEKAAMTAYKCV